VSQQALERGFCFETLGRNLMAYYKQSFPEIESMEILFLTSSDKEVMDLRRLLVEKDIASPLPEIKAKKISGCTYEIDCEDCLNKPICDRIREMAVQFENRKPISQEERRLLVREILK
jgi:CO dehydrogenase/acetyl-CoA synthase beta subunit